MVHQQLINTVSNMSLIRNKVHIRYLEGIYKVHDGIVVLFIH